MQTYLKNGYIVSMDQQDTVFDGGGVLVEDDRITAVGKVDPRLVKPDAEGWYTVSAGARIVVDYPVMVLPKTGDMPVWRWLPGL